MAILALAADPDVMIQFGKAPAAFPWLEIAKMGGAIAAFLIGLWQYRKAQRWKRVEFVAEEMKSFGQNVATKGARLMLDWSVKTIPLYRFRGDENDETTVKVTYGDVRAALAVPPPGFDKPQSAIREIFDEFLEFLERFEGYIDAQVVLQGDFDPYMHYWTRLLSGNDKHTPQVIEVVLPALWKFVGYYGYDNVLDFVDRYNKVTDDLRAAWQSGKVAETL